MLRRPPTHRVDAAPVLVLFGTGALHDDAWDMEKIEADQAEVAAINEDRDRKDRIFLLDHPVEVYRSGETRMDIDAARPWRGKHVAASDYFKAGAEPTRFVLRRLSWEAYYQVVSAQVMDSVRGAVLACRLGLARVEGADDLDIDPDASERSYDEMQRLFALDPNLPIAIGQAVIAASQPLRADEKKA